LQARREGWETTRFGAALGLQRISGECPIVCVSDVAGDQSAQRPVCAQGYCQLRLDAGGEGYGRKAATQFLNTYFRHIVRAAPSIVVERPPGIEVELAGGRRVRFDRDVDPETVHRLAALLEGEAR